MEEGGRGTEKMQQGRRKRKARMKIYVAKKIMQPRRRYVQECEWCGGYKENEI